MQGWRGLWGGGGGRQWMVAAAVQHSSTLSPLLNKAGVQQRAQGLERAAGGLAS